MEQPQPSPERYSLPFLHETMPRELGFLETEDLREARESMREAIRLHDPNAIEQYRLLYKVFAEKACDQLEGEAYLNAQIGRIIAEASLFFESGDISSYLDDIELAIELLRDTRHIEQAKALSSSVDEYYTEL